MKQAKNYVSIEGFLYEVDLKEGTTQDGKDYISGKVTFLVPQEVSGEAGEYEIPVSVWAGKVTKAGKANPAYQQAEALMLNSASLAAVGGDKTKADKYSVGGASLSENQFVAQDGKKVSYSQIRGSFFNKVTKDFSPNAKFEVEIVVKDFCEEIKDEVPTGRLLVNGIIVQWNDNCDIVQFVAEKPEAIEFITREWQDGDTVKISGRIRYAVDTHEVESTEEVGFGEPEVRVVKRTVKDFVITSGSPSYPDETAYDVNEILAALQAKKERLEAQQAAKDAAPASGGSSLRGF